MQERTDTIKATLLPTPVQQDAIEATMEAFAQASEAAVAEGQRLGTTSNAVLHRHCYRRLRSSFGLSANLTVRVIAYAARSLKAGPSYKALGDIVEYDSRTLSLGRQAQYASLSTVDGRLQDVSLYADDKQRFKLSSWRILRAALRRSQRGHYELEIDLASQPDAD